MKKKTSLFGPHQASLALVLKRNQKWITAVRFLAAFESYRGRFLRTRIHGSILKTGRSHHGIIYGFFLFSRSGFDEGWNAGTEKRVSIHTELHTRSSPPNEHSANHVTHHRFDKQKGGASSSEAGLGLKGHLHRGKREDWGGL
ncbi:hypothetical protein QQF64_004977 [Cirrhinus molitorella]|uniref:Uncharacterized protein n=1 Tax=Cirrhinus molitorella TaxID=172907 RepID=A0ABR3MHS5_9TELE